MNRVPCEFFLIRYVPDVVKGEFVNIGVVLRATEAGAPGGAAAKVRFTRDWGRVRCVDADADVELLEALEQEIGERLAAGPTIREPKALMEVLQDSLSNSLQISEPKATLAETVAAEMDLLMRMYVEPLKVAKVRSRSGRATIAGTMRTEFERAGVWGLMRKRIPAWTYTQAGDPLRIDCGYRTAAAESAGGAMIRMFQAVSLASDAEMAKVLAYSAPQIRDGVARVEGTGLELTAVVEALQSLGDPEETEAVDRYRFAVDTMERQQIRVVTLGDLARVAVTARRELGL